MKTIKTFLAWVEIVVEEMKLDREKCNKKLRADKRNMPYLVRG
jgi:hypothetical protein